MKYLIRTGLVAFGFFLAGCASDYQPAICASLDPEDYTETYDPIEPVNRKVHAFNDLIDGLVTKPAARVYQKLPSGVRNRVGDFTNNLKEPRNIISSALQGRPSESIQAAMRFVVNSTIGFAGLVDVASPSGIEYKQNDFGKMLAKWGVGDGPYVVIPMLGPSNVRDGIGSVIDSTQVNTTNEISNSDLRTGVQVTGVVDGRARLLTFTDIAEQQPDPYLFIRESYRQRRLDQICNP